MRVAVSGSAGRLGRAMLRALEDAPYTGPFGPIGWGRDRLDLDRPEAVGRLLDTDRVELLVHAAAWTDVDGCARDPQLAMRRNGLATGVIAAACAERGIDLVLVSTNEVFDGRRADGLAYGPADVTGPVNAYGASKLAGERAALEACAAAPAPGRLGIVRTAWLFGPPGNDFPAKILAAADRARAAGTALRVVADEVGNPTYTPDLAEGIAELIGSGDVSGMHHVVNAGWVSRAGWARELLRQAGLPVPIDEIRAADWERASTPPLWAALQPTALPSGEALRSWELALADYLPALLRSRAPARATR